MPGAIIPLRKWMGKPVELIPAYRVPEKVQSRRPSCHSQISANCLPYEMGFTVLCRIESATKPHPQRQSDAGTLCHRIVKSYTLSRSSGSLRQPQRGGNLYDQLLPSMASELLLEGRMVEKHRYREEIIRAIYTLVEAINRYGLTVEATEAPLEGEINGISLTGYADLLLRDHGGQAFVLDMKWSISAKYMRQEVEDGSALQLATYAWMLKNAEAAPDVHAGYFMLAQGQFISDSPLLGSNAVIPARSLEETWDMAVATLDEVWNDLEQGSLKAHGIEELWTHMQSGESFDKIRAQPGQYLERGYFT